MNIALVCNGLNANANAAKTHVFAASLRETEIT
jgi:hypothetical protein